MPPLTIGMLSIWVPIGHKQLGDAYLLKQMDKEAVEELQKAVQLSGGSPICIADLARA
jgi:hypothetical protein